jgi:3-hydroxybutyryl-CoA dehydrogenase
VRWRRRAAREEAEMIRTVGVVGAGQMGAGIAQVVAQSGRQVVLSDIELKLAEKGKAGIERALGKLVEKGKMQKADQQALLERIRLVEGLDALSSVDLVVEAATENVELKKQLFCKLDQVLPATAILASNTSSISITALAAVTKRPAKVIGMHFMNPVPLMQLVEVVRGLATDEETYRAVLALAGELNKTCVTSKDRAGFIVNRVLMPLINEAVYALDEGMASREDIDTAVKLGLNHPMGPLTLADLIGLDTCLFIMEVLHRELGDDKYRPCPLLRQYVAAGWLGRKSGRGFYEYAGK